MDLVFESFASPKKTWMKLREAHQTHFASSRLISLSHQNLQVSSSKTDMESGE